MENARTVGLKRNTIDKFYTKESAVTLCIGFIQQHLSISKSDLIIEPSAGNGQFLPKIKLLSDNYRFYDLEPDNAEVLKQDYLLLNYDEFKTNDLKIHIIGNPPFGRQSSLAIKFIKKSCEFCNSISFILPKSFKKDSLKKSFPLNFHLIFEIDLPENSFLVEGNEYNVDTVFQIWKKRDTNRELVEKIDPVNFQFVSKTDNPDISFRRVGVNAGIIDKKIEKSEQSHYFIRFCNEQNVDETINKLKNIHFTHNNTVGPRSISKQELIKEFNKYMVYTI